MEKLINYFYIYFKFILLIWIPFYIEENKNDNENRIKIDSNKNKISLVIKILIENILIPLIWVVFKNTFKKIRACFLKRGFKNCF